MAFAETSERRLRFRVAAGHAERDRIDSFVRAQAEPHRHSLDIAYRLTSPGFCNGEVALWETEDGRLVAFAAWQPSFRILDYGIDAASDSTVELVVDWLDDVFERRVNASGRPDTCWLQVGAAESRVIPLFERRGFVPTAWAGVHLERSVDGREDNEASSGFQISTDSSEADADAWAALHRHIFPRAGMTAEWRLSLLRSRAYRREFDLVAREPDGSLVALCLGWAPLTGATDRGQIEPFGTHPSFRRRRIGRALLLAMARAMANGGLRHVAVETWSDNAAAIRAYEAAGFRETLRVATFGKLYKPSV
jgi:ribosomal protein S18 acetylase RimI-like enzyme